MTNLETMDCEMKRFASFIATHSFAELSEHRLKNGEKRPSFDEYLTQAAVNRTPNY